MFWNEPNLYGYTYREVPHIPTPFFGQTPPRLGPFGMTPWTIPQVPPITAFYGMNFPQTLPVPQVPFYGMNFPQTLPVPQVPFYGMNFPQNLSHLPQQAPFLPQFPQINPLAFHGLPYRPF